jgi:hypothetical protein
MTNSGRCSMGKVITTSVLFLWMLLMAGCNQQSPKVDIEPVVFDHPDEVIKGSGDAEGYVALADRRVFAVMAFLNTAGYDQEVPNMQMHPIRVKVRKMISENLSDQPDKLQAWRQYYKDNLMGAWQYTNWALSLSSDYPFKRIRPDKELTYAWTSWMLKDFPNILNDFWTTANLDLVWAECRDDYLAELKKCDPNETAKGITFVWQYMRMQRTDNYIIIRVPNPLERYATANGNSFEHYFYSVEGPGSGGYIHEYLHTFVNEMVKANYDSQKSRLRKYFNAGRDAAISSSYQDPINWVSECLVHALDYRMTAMRVSDPTLEKRLEDRVDKLTQGGYTLLKPLHILLIDFEKSDKSFDQYLPIMFEKLPEYSPQIQHRAFFSCQISVNLLLYRYEIFNAA